MKIGRNDPCPCGSGRKYKHCCFQREQRGAGRRAPGEAARGFFEAAMRYQQEGHLLAAAASYRQAIAAQPALAGAHYNLGNVLQAQGEFADAVQSYRRALEIEPGWAEARCNLGSALKDLGRPEEAIDAYRGALAQRPDDVLAHYNLGNLLRDQGRLDEAAASYRQALALKPDFEDAYANLMLALRKLGRLEEAAECIRAWIALHPDQPKPYASLGEVLADQGRIEEAFEVFDRAGAVRPDSAEVRSWPLFHSGYCGLHAPAEYLALARAWEQAVIPAAERQEAGRRRFARGPLAGRRLRVGYVSGDFRKHAISFFLPQLFEHHDRARVEVFAYFAHDVSDSTTERMRGLVEHWDDVFALDDAALRRRIEADGIDVLVDLSGHTAHNRLGAFARRAAPVQAHYLGYFASTGLSEMDYFLCDEVLAPPELDAQFSEKLWRLPRVWLSYRSDPGAPGPERAPDPDGALRIGTFTDLKKIKPQTLRLWAKALHMLPGSKLLLKNKQLADRGNRERVLDAMAGHGVAASRVELVDSALTANWRDHMAYHARLDVALDPLDVNTGSTTTCEALWMGVPVVTLPGGRLGSRATASKLHAIGRTQWIARSEDEYLEKVAALARGAEARAALRGAMAASALCDAPGLARSLEDAYFEMRLRAA